MSRRLRAEFDRRTRRVTELTNENVALLAENAALWKRAMHAEQAKRLLHDTNALLRTSLAEARREIARLQVVSVLSVRVDDVNPSELKHTIKLDVAA